MEERYWRNYMLLVETERSLPCSQQLAKSSYPENPVHTHPQYLLKTDFNIILPPTPDLFRFSDKKKITRNSWINSIIAKNGTKNKQLLS
jgi:hypothetical protein